MSEKTFNTSKIAKLAGVSARCIRTWQHHGLLFGEKNRGKFFFGFQDLIAARAAKRLLQRQLSLSEVSRALRELREAQPEQANPLVRLQLDGVNGQVVLDEGCHVMDVATGQLHFSLDESPHTKGALVGEATQFSTRLGAKVTQSLEKYLAAAIAAELNEEWQAAAQAYRGMIRLEPQDVTAIVNLGNCHYRMGEFGVAIEVYRAALQVQSDCHEAWYNLANVLDETKQFEEAVTAFKTALAIAPNRFEIHYNLALTLEKIGARTMAKKHWQSVLDLSDDANAREMASVFLESYSVLDL